MKFLLIILCSTGVPFLCAQEGQSGVQTGTEISGLSLNDGQKWKMAPHMAEIIVKMEKTFTVADHKNYDSLKAAATVMKTQIDELITSCSMSGAPHDNLHALLGVLIPTVHELSNSKKFGDAEKIAVKLKNCFAQYNRHFE